MTLSELELIAEDSGIDPRYVKLAALEIEDGNESGMRNFWGGPLSCTIEREIDGEITDAIWERMVTEI